MKAKKNEILINILTALGIAGIIIVSLVAPNLLLAFNLFSPKRKYTNQKIRRSFNNMKDKKYVKVKNVGKDKVEVRLTEKGMRKLNFHILENLKLDKTKKWDGLHRVVLFDIPVKKNSKRRKFVQFLKQLEFKRLQKSVWITKHECDEAVEKITYYLGVEKFVTVALVKSFKPNLIT